MILNLSALMAWLSPVPACALSTCAAAPASGSQSSLAIYSHSHTFKLEPSLQGMYTI